MSQILAIPRAQSPALPLEGCWAWQNFAALPTPIWCERAEIEQAADLRQTLARTARRAMAEELGLPESALPELSLCPPAAIATDARFELWSRLTAEFVDDLSTTHSKYIPNGDILSP